MRKTLTMRVESDADTAFRAYLDTRFFGCLDGLRFLCITAVLFHHSPLMSTYSPVSILASRGFLGVDFFFVLSGFLITTLLLREERRKGRFSLAGFYRRRALRILPVYFLVVTAVGGYYVLVKGVPGAGELWIHYYLFLSNFLTSDIPLLGVSWSLSVEEQYYLVWPLLLLVTPRRILPGILVVLIALNVAISAGWFGFLGVAPPEVGHLRFALPNSTYAPILIGSLLAFALNRPEGFGMLYRLGGWRHAPLVALALLLAALLLLPRNVLGLPNLVLHLSMACLLASVVMREQNSLTPVLSWAPLRRIGQISYGLYLYHLIGLDLVNRLLPEALTASGLFVFVAYFAVSVAIAEVSFRYYETPFLRLRYRTAPEAASS
ncbi:MAG: acyltransferase family protein [Tropicimonas sp.]|uniref:acyltransferase family protein n=1 Tax=Tropicimonas sp. TaxID=2067044 RepID=UPI003A85EA45